MDASFGALLNNSPQRHSIIISPPEEWVVGTKGKKKKEKRRFLSLHPFHQLQSEKLHFKKT